MGRVDEGTQLWLDGDLKQRDKHIFEQSAGIERMVERLSGHKRFAYVHLEKSERSEVAAMADMLDD
jgi:predicted ribonuclease YlaK